MPGTVDAFYPTADSTTTTTDGAELYVVPRPIGQSLSDYFSLITPWQSQFPNFVETVLATIAPLVDLQSVEADMPSFYDLRTAVGVQLDVVGQHVGVNRRIAVPLAGHYFSLDVDNLGLDEGVLAGPYAAPYAVESLEDEDYRRLLIARILANTWDGTIVDLQDILSTFFNDPATLVFVEEDFASLTPRAFFSLDVFGAGLDEGFVYAPGYHVDPDASDMAVRVGVSGKIPSPILLAVLGSNALGVKPGGVQLDCAVTSVDGAPVFGLDLDNAYVGGLDNGSVGVSPTYFAENS